MMTHLSDLAQQIDERFPLATVELDEPANEGGTEHVDVRLGNRLVVIKWCCSLGFGVSLVTEAALDSGPDFQLASTASSLACVSMLLSEARDARFKDELAPAK